MAKKDIVYRRWFKVALVLVMFTPVYTQLPFDSRHTMGVIAEVFKDPYVAQVAWLLPIAKAALLAAALATRNP